MSLNKAMVFLLLASPGFAMRPTITALGGVAIPLSKIELSGGGEDDIGTAGFGGGVQVMMPVSDRFSIGADFLSHNFGEKTSDVLLPPTRVTYKLNAATFLAGARFQYPEGRVHPYLFGGIGVHVSSIRADIEPTQGLVWSDTHTAEKRRILDDSGSAFAWAFALGADYDISAAWAFGLEARYSRLGETTFTTRSIFAGAPTGEIQGTTNTIAILARLSWRFGPSRRSSEI